MVSNRVSVSRACLGALAALAIVSGCSWLHRGPPAVQPMPAPVSPADSPDAIATNDLTATDAALAAAGTNPPVDSPAQPTDPAQLLNPGAPRNYTVKRGDTLWGIATTFLKDPWMWPEVWYNNPQIHNPHLIYPGDTLALAFGRDGRPRIFVAQGGELRLEPRLRSSPMDGSIPTIPYSAISAFLTKPTVLSKEQLQDAPHVVAFRDEHVVAGTGHEVYISEIKTAPNTRYSIVHVGEELRDPDDGSFLGYEGIYTATALVAKPGKPSKALLIDAARETLQGDRVLTADLDVPLNFMLRAPRNDVHGRIVSVVDGTDLIGQYQIVVINRGRRHGIDAGHVLAVDEAGETVRDLYAGSRVSRFLGENVGLSFAHRVQLPDERAATMLIFKSFDRLSYGLIVGAISPIRVGDVVHNP